MTLEEAIAVCEANDLIVVTPRDSEDEQLRKLWDDALKTLRMARDIAEDGGKLVVRHPAFLNQKADAVALLRDGAVRMIHEIFANAVVEREVRDAA